MKKYSRKEKRMQAIEDLRERMRDTFRKGMSLDECRLVRINSHLDQLITEEMKERKNEGS